MPWYVVAVRSSSERKSLDLKAGAKETYLNRLVAQGTAEEVFPGGRGGRSSLDRKQNRSRSTLGREALVPTPVLPDAFVVVADSDDEVRTLMEQLEQDPTVVDVFVAPPRYVLATRRRGGAMSSIGVGALPNRWGTSAINLDKARQKPGFTDAGSVVVGIIDSGLDPKHPDLVGTGVSYTPRTARSRDRSGHGTHVTGILAAVPSQPSGMAGVCNPVLKVYQSLDPYSPTVYYRSLRDALETCDVVNLSLGGPHDPVEEQIIAAYAENTVVVAAMGNEYEDGNEPSYPAAIKGVIAVGAVDEQLRRGQFSNTGPHIALCAPGVRVWSTVPSYKATLAAQVLYDTWDGTSMAAPFVTGVVALLLAKDPTLVPSQIRGRLKSRHCFGQTSFSEEFGEGIIDAEATLR